MEIDRHTGLEVPGISWRYGWNGEGNHFHAFVVHGPFIYTIDDKVIGLGRRQGLVCIDTSNGQPKWWQKGYLPQTDTAFFAGEDLIIDNDTLVSLLYGNDTGFDLLNGFAFLQKTTLDGELVWVKKYDIPALIGVSASELIRVNDGYVIFGSSASSPSLKDGLFLLKTDFDGKALWARLFDYSTNDWIYRNRKGGELIEMDDFLYFTAFTGDAAGTTDLLLAKIDLDGLAGDSCAYFMPTPVETYTITNPVQEKPPLSFRNEAIDFITAVPANKTGVADIPGFETICERICEPEEGCDVKINGCVKFELLSIALDDAGDRHYRVRFTNSCAGQELNYIAIQLPKGTVAVAPGEGTVYTSEGGRPYEVRNPNAGPFYSIRFTPSGPGLAVGESDVFEYVLVGQAQPDYINVFARLWPGPSYEAHLNVFNCPVQMPAVQNREGAGGSVNIMPNPVTTSLNVGLPGAGSGQWQLFSPEGRLLLSGKWTDTAGFTIEVADLHPGVYFVRICRDGEVVIDRRFVKI